MEIKKITWDDSLNDILRPLLNDDFDAIKKEVQLGISELWRVNNDSYTITRIELDLDQKPFELVFVVGIGSGAIEAIEIFISKVKQLGINRFRVHSQRRGMGRFLDKLNFKQTGVVFERVDK